MLTIREAIVVEGRYDKNTLSQVVDTLILETNGFGIFKDPERMSLLRRAAERAGFRVGAVEDITDEWKRYYISALWRGEAEYPPEGAKNCRYLHAVLRKGNTA